MLQLLRTPLVGSPASRAGNKSPLPWVGGAAHCVDCLLRSRPPRLGSGRQQHSSYSLVIPVLSETLPYTLHSSGSLVSLGSLAFPGSVERVYAHVCLRVRSQINVRAVLAACVPRSAQRRFANRGEILATVPRTPCRSPASRFSPLPASLLSPCLPCTMI